MSKRATNLNLASPQLRTRVAVLAAGLGASAMLGVGVASAATGADTAPGAAAGAVAAQADAQSKAATAVKHAEQSKKEAPKGKPAEKKAEKKPESKPAKKKSAWTIPVNNATISATYGTGGDRWANKHSGQDYAVSVGTDVHSAAGGTVVKAGGNGAGDGPAYGNAVVVKHTDNTFTQYAHLSQINVSPGQTVKEGQKIALSGNTGNSSGPHLHFEVRTSPNYGSAIDPAAFLRSKGL
ncbi:M23 family metallopeptidase [Streptomyces albidoflavus]|uniref:M23 family metallopeptidase n=2 Tax=Streptomyces TaxID=1883 RepID=A0A126Y9S8_9ACTN|nr:MULTISPECIES: M23 family metallopeptidase [Streptomyces]MYX53944.1 peptidoglycan DD-metalloendopeptidase family protein [Streptomyces sp. SID8385]MYX85134.1 peptidoglycan DD-metalloendopeptidase family protein [Streptomyces sp. SID4915]QLA58256.1 M23 family metallopeptidase [Streptomyces violascens]AMM10151.1 Peptidase [Streptomyces albidoflavus]AWL32928.1 M23 family peptidase [Streptomyces sp. SM17]